MTTAAKQDLMRLILLVVQGLMLPAILWVATSLVDIKQRVAVIEVNVTTLTALHQEFNRHARDAGIHQSPDIKRAVTKEIVDEKIEKAMARIEKKIDDLKENVPPQWFRDYVEDLKRRVESLETDHKKGSE